MALAQPVVPVVPPPLRHDCRVGGLDSACSSGNGRRRDLGLVSYLCLRAGGSPESRQLWRLGVVMTQHCCADRGLDVGSLCENASMFNDETLTLLSPADVARLVGVHRNSVYRWINAGELPALRLGDELGPLRVRSDRLEQWLAQHPATPKEEHGRAA
jgi:excisionase family DNA binding protein